MKLGVAANQEEVLHRNELFAYILWQLWKNRNIWHFQSVKYSPHEVVQNAWSEWLEYKEVQGQQKPQRANNSDPERLVA